MNIFYNDYDYDISFYFPSLILIPDVRPSDSGHYLCRVFDPNSGNVVTSAGSEELLIRGKNETSSMQGLIQDFVNGGVPFNIFY